MSDAEIYVAQCLMCLSVGLGAGMFHRAMERLIESLGTG